MATDAIAPPEGFVLDQAGGPPPPPPGFALDAQAKPQPPTTTQRVPNLSWPGRLLDVARELAPTWGEAIRDVPKEISQSAAGNWSERSW